jgi:predicted metal-dependent hydrolase
LLACWTAGRARPIFPAVSKKSAKIAALIESCRGRPWPAHYLGYFECFNRGLFYEAHDVLEELWLEDRRGPNGNFYKGLIQFAGAFVHLQKHDSRFPRLRPAAALLTLARGYLEPYAPRNAGLDVARVLALAWDWRAALEAGRFVINPLANQPAPQLEVDKTSGE